MGSLQKRGPILNAFTSYALNKISDYFNYSLLQGVLGGVADCSFRGSWDEIFVSFLVNTMTEWFLLNFSHDRNHPPHLPGFYLIGVGLP